MDKRCIIEVGSNTVKLFIAKILTNSDIEIVENQRRITLLGKKTKKTNKLSIESMEKTIHYMEEYLKIIESHHIKPEDILLIATAACRNTTNGSEFIDTLKKEYKINHAEILTGEQEAKYGYLGCLASITDNPNNLYSVIDIGGGSFQLSFGYNDKCIQNNSYPIGCNNITEEFHLHTKIFKEEINSIIHHISSLDIKVFKDNNTPITLVGIGGTIKIMQLMIQSIDDLTPLKYDILLETAYFLGELETDGRFNWIKERFPDKEIREKSGLTHHRAEVFLGGLCIALGICKKLQINEINLSNTDTKDYLIRLKDFPATSLVAQQV